MSLRQVIIIFILSKQPIYIIIKNFASALIN